jgi:hypothetical protein
LPRQLGETASERPESLESNLNLGAWIDEVVVVTAGTVGDRAEAHHGAGLEGRYKPQPREHIFGLVADLGY